MSLTLEQPTMDEPVLLTSSETQEVKGGFLLAALWAACSGCPSGTGSTRDPGTTGDTGANH